MGNLEAMAEVMRAHAARYPLMEPQDWYKLIYQGEFGGGHLIADAEAARARFMDEWEKAGTPGRDEMIEEPVGGGLCRVHLRPARDAGILPEAVFGAFLSGAGEPCGNDAGMREKIRILVEFLATGDSRCTAEGLLAFIGNLEGEGFPQVSHSEAYRAHYRPSYRIIRAGELASGERRMKTGRCLKPTFGKGIRRLMGKAIRQP